MSETSTRLGFDERGIASALAQRDLHVPLNQRAYAWDEGAVQTLLDDLYRAFDSEEAIYFLGTIVLTRSAPKSWEIADGQQRLATTSIVIAAVRDYLLELGDEEGAKKYQSQYLLDYNVRKKEFTPKLYLNYEDHEFFLDYILKPPKERDDPTEPKMGSHKRLATAFRLATSHVRRIVAPIPEAEKPSRLYDWMDFLDDAAKVIVITVPGNIGNTFTMFETLNARGVDASKTDILKNYVFELAKDRLGDAHPRWMSMVTTIETQGDDDLLMKFVRHLWIAQHGPTTERELGSEIQKAIRTERQAMDFLRTLDTSAVDYVALLSPRDNARWNLFNRRSQDAIHTVVRVLGGEQIRPLMLAVAQRFSVKEAERAFQAMVSWAVRFLIVGGAGGGVLERYYGLRAREVSKGELATAQHLISRMADVVPGDTAFRQSFEAASVRRTNLARYYLRSLELHAKGEDHPQFVPSDDTLAVNVEHILPVHPAEGWRIRADVAEAYYRRIGNMVLLQSKKNVEIGNKPFAEKRKVLRQSPFVLTAETADNPTWGPPQIEDRQQRLADQAVEVWPI